MKKAYVVVERKVASRIMDDMNRLAEQGYQAMGPVSINKDEDGIEWYIATMEFQGSIDDIKNEEDDDEVSNPRDTDIDPDDVI